MKISFLVSSLEAGKDGVGDHALLLAGECIRQGHECRITAMRDRGVADGAIVDTVAPAGDIRMLRFSSALSWQESTRKIREFHGDFAPDWVSLHFVPYGFDKKGIVCRVAPYLASVTAGLRLQIMFHELWIGGGIGAPVKERVVGAIQRHCVLRMLQSLKPAVVATSNYVYKAMLHECGVEAMALPLFANISVTKPADGNQFPPELLAAGVPPGFPERSACWICLIFGGLPPEWNPEPLFGILLRASKQAAKRLYIVGAGRLGPHGERCWEELSAKYAREMSFIKLGVLPAAAISHLMQAADFCVAGGPLQLIGKSSSVSSMLDHGRSVIVNRDDWRTRTKITDIPERDSLLHPLDEHLEAKLVRGLERREPCPRLPQIAREFLNSLSVSS